MRQSASAARPRLFQAVVDAFKLPDLRAKLLFTLAMLVVFRFVAHVSIPGIDREALGELFDSNALLGMLNLFSGGAMRNLSIAAMGVYPYITASIIMTLMTPIIPRLQAISREGESGRKRLNLYTHYLTVPLAMLSSYGQLMLFQSQGVVTGVGFSGGNLLPTAAMVLTMTAGTIFLVWLGERITESGIGNGISIIIFGGIIAGLPGNISNAYLTTGTGGLIKLLFLMIAICFFIVFVTEAVRRIPVQYSRSIFRGGKMYRQAGGTHIPLKVNSAGMIPLIFAMSIVIFPGTVSSYFANNTNIGESANIANHIQNFFSADGGFYWGIFFILVVGFTFFYTMVVFQQQNLPETLQKQGGFIPGVRPGRPTADYLTRVITRITWGGALFLGTVAIMPLISRALTGGPTNLALMLISSTGLLIVVGVVLDTMRQLESQLMMRRYEGFIK
ncbi:preprotein translocase subunit SecY [Chloroflexota bacterium]